MASLVVDGLISQFWIDGKLYSPIPLDSNGLLNPLTEIFTSALGGLILNKIYK